MSPMVHVVAPMAPVVGGKMMEPTGSTNRFGDESSANNLPGAGKK